MFNQEVREGFSKQRKAALFVEHLFQKNSYELFLFPYTPPRETGEKKLPGKLFVCEDSAHGFIICFLPNPKPTRTDLSDWTSLKYNCVLNKYQDTDCFLLIENAVSCLFTEAGWVNQDSCGQYVLRGIELTLLQQSKQQALFCKKVETDQSAPERPLPNHLSSCHSKYSKFVNVSCCCRAKGFSCHIRLPVLTPFELQGELNVPRTTKCESSNDLQEENIFPCGMNDYVICFPRGMGVNLPFLGIAGGNLFLSYKENNILQFVFILNLLCKKRLKIPVKEQIFPSWQTGLSYVLHKTLFKKQLYCFSDPRIRLNQNNSLEYFIEGVNIKLVSKEKTGLWGIFFSRQQKEVSESTHVQGKFSNLIDQKETVLTHQNLLYLDVPSSGHQSIAKSSSKKFHPYKTHSVQNTLNVTSLPLSIIQPSQLDDLIPLTAPIRALKWKDPAQSELLQLPTSASFSNIPFDQKEGSCQMPLSTLMVRPSIKESSLQLSPLSLFLQTSSRSETHLNNPFAVGAASFLDQKKLSFQAKREEMVPLPLAPLAVKPPIEESPLSSFLQPSLRSETYFSNSVALEAASFLDQKEWLFQAEKEEIAPFCPLKDFQKDHLWGPPFDEGIINPLKAFEEEPIWSSFLEDFLETDLDF